MRNKKLFVALTIAAVAVIAFGWNMLSGTGSEDEAVTLTTDPNPLQAGPATFIIDV